MNAHRNNRRPLAEEVLRLFALGLICALPQLSSAEDFAGQPEVRLRVAIVGAVAGEPAVYEMPLGASVADAFRRAGGLSDTATGQFRLLRGSGVRQLVQSSDVAMELRDGDAVAAIDRLRATSPERTVVLICPNKRPIVSRLPASEINIDGLCVRRQLADRKSVTIIPSPLTGEVPDGVFIGLRSIDEGFWQTLASHLPVKPIAAPASFSTENPAVEIQQELPSRPQVREITVEPLSIPTPRSADSDLTIIEEPLSLPTLGPSGDEASSMEIKAESTLAVSEVVRIPESIFDAADTPIEMSTNGSNSMAATNVVTAIAPPVDVTYSGSGPTLAMVDRSSQTAAVSEPRVLENTTASNAMTLAQVDTAAGLPANANAATAIIPAGLIGLAVGVVLVVGGGYVVAQSLSAPIHEPASLSQPTSSETSINDQAVIQEDAPVSMPLTIVGRAVALGKLRIDAAHSEPSGPHFAIRSETEASSGESRTSRVRGRRPTISSNDILGRALAVMEQERS